MRLVAFIAAGFYRNGGKYQRQASEYQGLKHADQQLQAVDTITGDKRDQERHHEEQDFTRSHVPEKTEGKADNADEMAEKLNQAD
jgi:hypothetical protein